MADTTTWPEVMKTLVTVATTLSAVGLGAYLNASNARALERERAKMAPVIHGREKIWEHRREAYSAIIGKLHQFAKEAEDIDDSFRNGEMDPEEYWRSPGYDAAHLTTTNLFKASRDLFDEARLIISAEFEARFVQMRNEVYASDEDDDPPTQARNIWNTAQSAYDDLLEIAKREITPVLPEPPTKKARGSFRGLLWWAKAEA